MKLTHKSVTVPSIAASVLVIAGLACSPTALLPSATATLPPSPTSAPPTESAPPTAVPTREPVVLPTLAPTLAPKPTKIPATATPVPSSGDIIYLTDFDDFTGWDTLSLPNDGSYTNEIRDGQLYIEVTTTDTYVYAFYKVDLGYSDVSVGVRARTVAGPNLNNIGLVCRASDRGWYEFNMTSGGLYDVYRFEPGTYTLLASGGSTAINLQRAQNDLVINCQGDQLTFYINNVLVASVQDSTFRQGFVGLSVSTFDKPGAGVEFDRLAVALP